MLIFGSVVAGSAPAVTDGDPMDNAAWLAKASQAARIV